MDGFGHFLGQDLIDLAVLPNAVEPLKSLTDQFHLVVRVSISGTAGVAGVAMGDVANDQNLGLKGLAQFGFQLSVEIVHKDGVLSEEDSGLLCKTFNSSGADWPGNSQRQGE